MDPTDVRIFCEMAFGNQGYREFRERHPSAAAMGKKLGLDEKTVRVRVNRMEETGFIKYYQTSPNLALFGMHIVSLFRFEALNLSTKNAVFDHLHQVPRLLESSDYLGRHFTGSLAGATAEEAKSGAVELAARYELGTVALGSRELKEPSTRLDRLDWRIVEKLRYDASSTDKDLAEALEVTRRMIGYRVARLLGSGAIQTKAVIDPQQQAGLVFYELELLVDIRMSGAVARWLKEKYGDRLWNLRTPTPDVILASFFCFTLAEPESSAIEALRHEGIKRCLLLILKEVIEPRRPNWIDDLIQLRITSEGVERKPLKHGTR